MWLVCGCCGCVVVVVAVVGLWLWFVVGLVFCFYFGFWVFGFWFGFWFFGFWFNKFPESAGRVLGEGMPPGPTSQVCQQRKELMFYTLCRFFRGHCHEASYWFVCWVRFFCFLRFGFWFLVWFVACGWFVVVFGLVCGCVVVVVAVVGLWFAFAVCGWFVFCFLVLCFGSVFLVLVLVSC